jgi:UPF0755 protein
MNEEELEEKLPEEEPQEPKAPKRKKRGKILRIILFSILGLGIIAASIAFYYYNLIFGKQLNDRAEAVVITIPTGTSLKGVAKILQKEGIIELPSYFSWVAQLRSYEGKAGKYKIPKETNSYYELVGILRSAQQVPIKLTFNNLRFKEQLAGIAGELLECDSIQIAHLMQQPEVLESYGLNDSTAMTLFIPDTYEFFWNTSAEEFMERMHKEYQKFWKAEGRLAKADSLGMSPTEVYTLASIVDAETTYKPEKPRIAGVYLNRLNTKGWKLEADPTVVFAVGDFSIRRVTKAMLETDSPYNTYMYPGLPPGPIRMASKSAIDAVLNAEKHNYWFFCAKPPVEGEPASHAFARTSAQHGANARRYRAWLNSQRIYR